MNNNTLRQSLRLSAILLLVGQLLYIVITLFHTGGEANNHPAIFAAYAASESWMLDHLAQFLAMAILLAGLFALFFALEPIPMSSASLKDLVEYLAKALVDNPDDVEVAEISGEQTVVLELRVAKEDLGKVIGKQGRTVKAMRAILSAASSKLRKRADLEILE